MFLLCFRRWGRPFWICKCLQYIVYTEDLQEEGKEDEKEEEKIDKEEEGDKEGSDGEKEGDKDEKEDDESKEEDEEKKPAPEIQVLGTYVCIYIYI